MDWMKLIDLQIYATGLRETAQHYGAIKSIDLYYELMSTADELEELIQIALKKKRA